MSSKFFWFGFALLVLAIMNIWMAVSDRLLMDLIMSFRGPQSYTIFFIETIIIIVDLGLFVILLGSILKIFNR